MRGQAVQNYVDFTGGLNTSAAPFTLEATQVRDALNVHVTPTGTIRKRNGFTELATTGVGVINSLAAANTEGTKALIASSGTKLLSVLENGSVTTIGTGFTADAKWSWAQAQLGTGPVGPMYGMNGIDTPQTWDGSAGSTSDWVATTGTVPVGSMIKYHASRLWVAGVTANPSTLYFSGITGTAPDTLNWDSDFSVDFEPEDGQAITAIGAVGGNLIVFKPRKTWIVYDIVTGANRQLSEEIGCIAPRSVVETPQGTFFLSETDGVLSTNGNKIHRISDNVITDFIAAAASQPTLSNACGVYDGSSYFLSIASGLIHNDVTYEYDLQTNSWWKHDCASNQWALVDPIGSPVLYSASPAVDSVQRAFVDGIFTDSDDNYAGDTYFTTAYLIWGQPAMMKRVRAARDEGVGVWEAQYATNFHDDFATLDGETWDSTAITGGIFGGSDVFGGVGIFGPPSSGVTSHRYYTPGRARAWSFKLINTDANDFQVYEVTAAVDPVRD